MKAIRRRMQEVSQRAAHHLGSMSSGGEHRAHQASRTMDKRPPVPPRLPDDIIYEVAQYVDTGHIYRVLLLSKSLYEIMLPLLWSVIDTRTSVMPERQINELNKTLKLKPERALLIKQWIIGMDVIMPLNHLKLPTETANVVIELAEKKHLVNLTKFGWFWKSGPPEQLWAALHTNCPLLKDIGARRGPDELTISPDSTLLRFSDLVGFHLTTHGVYRFHHPNQIAANSGATRIPTGLYEMLIKRSPRLRELTFDGSCPHVSLWDVSPILEATWPELRSLSLGMIRDTSKRLVQGDQAKAMKNFIGRHQELQNVNFLGAAHWASNEAMYSITSHQKLVAFRGRYAQLKVATDLPSLRSVHLTDLFMDSANYSGILGRFGAITTLGLIVDVQQKLVQSMCQSIFEACPMLVHLDLRLRQGLTDYIDIVEISQKAVHLRALTLVGLHTLMDGVALATKGLTIVQKNPRLDSFALYFGEQFNRACVSGVTSDRYTLGEFTVSRDRPCGRPRRLLIKEVRKGFGVNFAHRYVREVPKDWQPPTDVSPDSLFSYAELSPWYTYTRHPRMTPMSSVPEMMYLRPWETGYVYQANDT